MFNLEKTLTVIKRELRDKLLSKTFVLMTLLLPILMFGILALQTFLYTIESDEGTKLELIAESDDVLYNVRAEFMDHKFIQNGYYKIEYIQMDNEQFSSYLDNKKQELLNDQLNGIIFIPDNALTDKEIEYYSKNPNNRTVFDKLSNMINIGLVNTYFNEKNLSDDDVKYASLSVDFNPYRISSDEGVEEEGAGNIIASFLFTFLLYFSLIFLGTMMMRAVVEEKTSKIVEVLLSSCSSRDLMTGKILGNGITGAAQMAIWLLPVIVVITTSIFTLPPDLKLQIDPWMIIYFLLNYIIGLLTFLGLFASVGAIFDNDQDAQSGLWPVMMLIMIPFFIGITAQSNPESGLLQVTSLLPFSSIIVLPARMTLVEIPLWQIILAVIVNLFTFFGVFVLAGKIYRIGILRTGKKPKWSEVAKWLKYKY